MSTNLLVRPSELQDEAAGARGNLEGFWSNREDNVNSKSRREARHDYLQSELDSDPDLWMYRERTIAMLRRYLRLSIEVGRLPSLLGRELFRSRVTSYRMSSFEDAVIFVHDVEKVLEQLELFDRELLAIIVFEDFSQDEAAEILHCGRRTICRQLPETLDRVSELFLRGGLLNRLPPQPSVENYCQEGKNALVRANDCKQSE
jgi:DNA-directed RNA polymerase specialized sigma24 family protein